MKKLQELINEIEITNTVKGIEDNSLLIENITNDSRKVKPGWLFVSIPGFRLDGKNFINDAISKGAVAIIYQGDISDAKIAGNVAAVQVPDARLALGKLAAAFYGHPDQKLNVIGITGTNGKTTTAFMVRAIIEKTGKKCGLLGTIAYEIGDQYKEAGRTTPESIEIEEFFNKAVQMGAGDVVMEVSSHALDLMRVDEIEFDQAIFTNLGMDHLDYHKTVREYLKVKMKLFRQLGALHKKNKKTAIVNSDDPNCNEILDSVKTEKITYGLSQKATIWARPIKMNLNGISFELNTPIGSQEIHLNLTGNFNIYNALAASSSAFVSGIPLVKIKEGLESLKNIPGRFEKIKGKVFDVIVDYAHTPEALKNLLVTAREVTKGKLIVVFGCGGERDRSKRPIMGEIAATFSDICILTSDNPRREDPFRILLDAEAGIQKIKQKGQYSVFVDRKEAIEEACKNAREGDLVVIAGKGHENYQIIGDESIHFDDRETAREIMKRMGD